MKKLYKQFNDIGTNEVIEPMPMTEMEKERIKRIVLKNRKKHLPRTLSAALVSVVSALVLGVLVSVSNPAFAESIPVIGNIFDLFKDNEKEYVFEEYGDYASHFSLTQESNGVRITVTDAVYDRENITLAYTIESEQDLGEDPSIDGDFYFVGEGNYFQVASQTTEKLDDNTYAGIFIGSLQSGEHPESIDFEWNGTMIRSFDKETASEVIEPIEGKWDFKVSLGAIEHEVTEFENLTTIDQGIEIELNKMATTPITTSFYLTQIVDKSSIDWIEDKWENIVVNYKVYDNLGKEYVLEWDGAWGNSENVMESRIFTKKIDEEATTLTITPIISILKYKYDDVDSTTGRELELVKEPFEIKPIIVPLDRN
jgi:hypothetical protein